MTAIPCIPQGSRFDCDGDQFVDVRWVVSSSTDVGGWRPSFACHDIIDIEEVNSTVCLLIVVVETFAHVEEDGRVNVRSHYQNTLGMRTASKTSSSTAVRFWLSLCPCGPAGPSQ